MNQNVVIVGASIARKPDVFNAIVEAVRQSDIAGHVMLDGDIINHLIDRFELEIDDVPMIFPPLESPTLEEKVDEMVLSIPEMPTPPMGPKKSNQFRSSWINKRNKKR